MRLMGWVNVETGEVKSPYAEVREELKDGFMTVGSQLITKNYRLYAFSGIHSFSPSLFSLMDNYPDRFPIIGFYVQNCDKVRIQGVVKEDLKLMDVGKLETLAEAEDFLKTLV